MALKMMQINLFTNTRNALNQKPLYIAVFLTGRILRIWESSITPNHTLNDSLENSVLSVLAILGSLQLDVLVPNSGSLLPGDTARVLLNYKLWLWSFGLHATSKRVKELPF